LRQATLSKTNPTAREFDQFYGRIDPWGIRNTVPELARQARLNQEFRHCRFENGLDIGCGEGHLTAALRFVRHFDAIDVSQVALERARTAYPHIDFKQLGLSDLGRLPAARYDFISCFETLYYLSEDGEREAALRAIKERGRERCVFCFSVVIVGENEHRRYFSYDGAVAFFKRQFNIIHHFPITLGSLATLPWTARLERVRLRLLGSKERRIAHYEQLLRQTPPEKAYQCVFVVVKNDSEMLAD